MSVLLYNGAEALERYHAIWDVQYLEVGSAYT